MSQKRILLAGGVFRCPSGLSCLPFVWPFFLAWSHYVSPSVSMARCCILFVCEPVLPLHRAIVHLTPKLNTKFNIVANRKMKWLSKEQNGVKFGGCSRTYMGYLWTHSMQGDLGVIQCTCNFSNIYVCHKAASSTFMFFINANSLWHSTRTKVTSCKFRNLKNF